MSGPACRFCGDSLPSGAVLCRGCGATLARRSISVWPLLLFLPLAALGAVLGAAVEMELPLRTIALAFPLAWLALGLIYVAWTRRATWRRGETLVLTAPDAAAPARGWTTLLTSQWSMGATTAAVVGTLWIASAGQPLEPANAALVLPLDGGRSTLAAAPTPASTSVPAPLMTTALVTPLPLEKPAFATAVAAAAPAARSDEQPATSIPGATTVMTVAATIVEPRAAGAATAAEASEQAVILTAQKMLDGLGYSVGKIDGKPGSKTRVAVQSFRERQGLGSGETIDTGLVAALERATAQRQDAIQRARQQQASAVPASSQPPAAQAPAPAAQAPAAAVLPASVAATPSSAPARLQQVSHGASAPLRLRREPPLQSAKVGAAPDTIGF